MPSNLSQDIGRDSIGGFMFPVPKHGPSVGAQQNRGFFVAPSVSIDLLRPIVDVRLRLPAMRWASVPKAPIDEYGYAMPRKTDVCPQSSW
jgi:hypothetical protein